MSRLSFPLNIRFGWEAAVFLGIALAALGLRLWELDGRAMHYDEGIHVHYAWRMAIGEGYSHSPWMHGPLQVHLTALIFKLFSDSDFTARLLYALFGSALVALPYFLRTYLGRTGAIATAVMLALSPALLYFSRFGRNDILMAFWAVALLILMWRYVNEGKNRYLYMASAVLALAFATKETSYIIVVIFGAALFLMSLTEIIPWMLGRLKFSQMSEAPAFLILLATLSLPQWSALISKLQGTMGVVLAATEGGTGEVGLPPLNAPPISFPVVNIAGFLDGLILAAVLVIPILVIFRTGFGRAKLAWLASGAILAALVYAFFAFPHGDVPRGYLISLMVLLAVLVVSAIIGLMWRWKVWLLCAGIFYLIWTMFYTSVFGLFVQNHGFCPTGIGGFFGTLCSKLGGVYTGSWQGLGYWMAQQEVARGGQPWYYHFLLGSVYEFLPLLFGVIAMVYYLRKGELFGILLSFWAVMTALAYTLAGEKMPWLLVNLAVPFILLSGKFIGEIIERVPWHRVFRGSPVALLVLPPLLLLAGVYLLHDFLGDGSQDSWQDWGLLSAIIVIAMVSVALILRARPRLGMSLVGISMAVLLLGFSSFVAFRASYNYDDTPVEMLVYAQGSADLIKTARTLNDGVTKEATEGQVVEVDYEIWYPFNWYVRHEQDEGALGFRCYKEEGDDGYASYCNPLDEVPSTKALLITGPHSERGYQYLGEYERNGPFKNLLWFPEKYRRPGENRKNESKWEQLKKDFQFAQDTFTSREPWRNALDYFLFRRLGGEWWDSQFFSYIARETPS